MSYSRPFGLKVIGLTLVVCIPCFPHHAYGQRSSSISITKTFEVAGENAIAGIELANPSALILDDEYIWIADDGLKKLFIVDAESKNVLEFGREGAGPGEFNTLLSLCRFPDNQVGVLDQWNQRISLLEVDNGEVSLVTTIPVKLIPWSMCVSGERLIVLGWYNGKFLHELDDSGQVINSFAEPFRTEQEFRGMSLGARSILVGLDQADSSFPAVVAASTEFGVIRGYNVNGDLLWEAIPEGFRPIDISPSSQGSGLVFRMPRGGSYQIIASMLSFESGVLLLQVATIGEGGLDSIEKLETYTISTYNGQITLHSENHPKFNDRYKDRAAGIENHDYPKVSVYRIHP